MFFVIYWIFEFLDNKKYFNLQFLSKTNKIQSKQVSWTDDSSYLIQGCKNHSFDFLYYRKKE